MSNPYDPNNPYGSPEDGQGNQPPPPPYGGAEQGNQPPPPYGQTPYPQEGAGQDPYGQTPYGQPYGQGPYGQSNAPEAARGTDAVSITGFVLSLTCCLSIVGAILGVIGLRRTKDNQRKGRWAAISALVIGVLGTLAFAGIIVAAVFFANSVIPVDEAEVGQCANVTSEDSESVLLTDAECDSPHDAEIVYTGTYGEVENSRFVPSNPDDLTDAGISFGVCTELIAAAGREADLEALGDDVTYQFVTQTADPPSDEAFYCYVERTDGEKFDTKRLP